MSKEVSIAGSGVPRLARLGLFAPVPALVQHEEDEQLTDGEEARPEAVEPAVADLVLRGRRARVMEARVSFWRAAGGKGKEKGEGKGAGGLPGEGRRLRRR